MIAFVVLAAMSVGAFFLDQKLKAAKPVVWNNPQPRPTTFDPVGGSVCRVDGRLVDYRRTYLQISPTQAGRVAVYVYRRDGDTAIATLSAGRYMRATSYATRDTAGHKFFWNGREADGSLAPAGHYIFRFVLLDLDDHAVDLTGYPIRLITSAHPPERGCFHARRFR